MTLPFLYSTEKEEWLRDAVSDFEKAHPEVDVHLEPKGSLDAVRALLAGESKPVLWSPADSLAATCSPNMEDRRGADPLVREDSHWPRSLLLTPLVFVAWESRAKVLLGKSTDLMWSARARRCRLEEGLGGPRRRPRVGIREVRPQRFRRRATRGSRLSR